MALTGRCEGNWKAGAKHGHGTKEYEGYTLVPCRMLGISGSRYFIFREIMFFGVDW